MYITQHQSRIKTLRQSDPDFKIVDGFVVYPRAGFHILPECPQNYKQVINECIANGWLKPVAHMMNYECTMDKLKEAQ